MLASAPLFSALFQRALFLNVEFSISEDVRSQTLMVPADAASLRDMESWIETYPFADEWFVAVRNLTREVAPDAALFRIDLQATAVSTFSWYLRFPTPPGDETFAEAMQYARPFRWHGPSPASIASSMNLPGPRGLGLRVHADGRSNSALYYRAENVSPGKALVALEHLVIACGLNASVAAEAGADLKLISAAELSVVGIDQGSAEQAGALKFNLGDVPVATATGWLARKGAAPCVCERVQRAATVLKARTLSYLGLKYNQRGFAGWRAYFSCEPARGASLRSINMVGSGSMRGKTRLPQY
jgi:hypothetical protein